MSNPYRLLDGAGVWPAHPTWRHRYDFVTASPPGGRVVSRHTAAVSYLEATGGVGTQALYITHVHWRSRSGVTRSELVAALHVLCGRYEFVEGVTLSRAGRRLRSSPPDPADTSSYAAWNDLVGVVNEVQAPAYWFAAAYGQQLSLLSDAEMARTPPTARSPSPHHGHLSALVNGTASLHWSRFDRNSSGTITDFGWDVARRALNARIPLPAPHVAQVLQAKTRLEAWAAAQLPTYAESEANKGEK